MHAPRRGFHELQIRFEVSGLMKQSFLSILKTTNPKLLTSSRRDLVGCRFLAFDGLCEETNQVWQTSELWAICVLRLILGTL